MEGPFAWRANALPTESVRERDAFLGECIDIRRVDLAAVAADVREAHVIGHYHDDVWTRRSGEANARHGNDGDEAQCD